MAFILGLCGEYSGGDHDNVGLSRAGWVLAMDRPIDADVHRVQMDGSRGIRHVQSRRQLNGGLMAEVSKTPKPKPQYSYANERWIQWASDRELIGMESGHSPVSVTYRMMREGDSMPGGSSNSPLEHRAVRTKSGLKFTRKVTALGKQNRARQVGLTRPEIDADRFQKSKTMETIFRSMPAEWQAVVAIRYLERERSYCEIARRLGLDRKEVPGFIRAILAWSQDRLRQA